MTDFSPFAALRRFRDRLRHRAAGGPVWRGGATDLVATLYSDGVILDVSSSAAQIIGAAGALSGRSILDFVARDDRARVRAAFEHVAERNIVADPAQLTVDFTLLRVRKAAAPATLTLKPGDGGRVSALIRLDAGAQRRLAPAPDAPPAAPVDQAAPVDLVANLAHELKTPLNAIIGFADAMRAQTYGPLGADATGARKYAEYADHIHASGAHLSALIGAAQDYAKTRSGQYRIDRAPVDAVALARECLAMIERTADGAQIDFTLTAPSDGLSAMLDARAIRQILINLLSNAVKFTRAGEIELSVEAVGDRIDFAVRDTGVGMNKVVLAKLGGRYSDTHRTGVRGADGAGLGLSLAFELARLHGGTLRFASEPDVGTIATLSTPRNANTLRDAPAADVQSQLDRVNAFRAERARAADAA